MKYSVAPTLFRVACILPLSASILLSSCSSITESIGSGVTQATKRPGSFKTKKEFVSVSIHKQGTGDAVVFPEPKSKVQDGTQNPNAPYGTYGFGLPPVLAGAAAGYIMDGIEKGVASTAGNYSVIYSGSRIGDDLPKARGFELERKTEEKPAVKMQLDFKRCGNAYTLGLSSIKLDQSKSAVPIWDNDIDMVVKVQLGVLDPEKNSMVQVIDTEFEVKGVELGKTRLFNDQEHRTSWFRFPAYLVDKKTPKVPYKLVITVQETSNFYKVAEKGKTLVTNKKKDWTTSLTEKLANED